MHLPALIATAVATLLTLTTAAQTLQARAPAVDLHLTAGRLTLKADNLSAEQVLAHVARALDARLFVAGTLDARSGPWNLQQVPVLDALMQIARPAGVLVVQERDMAGGADNAIREIHIFAASDADAQERLGIAPPAAQSVAELTRQLGADDSQTRRSAAQRLGNYPTPESVRALERGLSDADRAVRLESLDALGRIGTDEAIRLVGQTALAASDTDLASAAMRILEASTSQHAQALLQAIHSHASRERQAPRQTPRPR